MYRILCYFGLGLLILEAAVSPLHASEITGALPVQLTQTMESHGTDVPEAYDAYLRGMRLLSVGQHLDTKGNAAAQAIFEEARAVDELKSACSFFNRIVCLKICSQQVVRSKRESGLSLALRRCLFVTLNSHSGKPALCRPSIHLSNSAGSE
jgi:hypothetical protein